jgi:hypothetical protein
MERNLADAVAPTLTVGAHCPVDATLVMCSGPRGAKMFTGACGVCNRLVYANASFISQTGSLVAPDLADLELPVTEKPDAQPGRSNQESPVRA